jgi:hypothetical protein
MGTVDSQNQKMSSQRFEQLANNPLYELPGGDLSEEEFRELVAAKRENERLREVLLILSEHEPSWSDDFLRARSALIGVKATLGGAHAEKTGSTP